MNEIKDFKKHKVDDCKSKQDFSMVEWKDYRFFNQNNSNSSSTTF